MRTLPLNFVPKQDIVHEEPKAEVNLACIHWHWSSHVVVHCWTYSWWTQNMAIAWTRKCSVSRRVWELAWNRPLFVRSELTHTGPLLLFVLCLFHWQTHINKSGIRPESSLGVCVCVRGQICACMLASDRDREGRQRKKKKDSKDYTGYKWMYLHVCLCVMHLTDGKWTRSHSTAV